MYAEQNINWIGWERRWSRLTKPAELKIKSFFFSFFFFFNFLSSGNKVPDKPASQKTSKWTSAEWLDLHWK